MHIDFGQLIHALSDTIDLVGVDEIEHGKRVGFMAQEISRIMGADRKEQIRLYHAGLLHDCGVSSTRVHRKLVDELDWTESQHHCQIGSERLRRFGPLADFADITLYHHTQWQQLEGKKLPDAIKCQANLIYMADRVDALAVMQGKKNRLACREGICNIITRYRGSHFKPELVDAFLGVAEKESFWITQQPEHLRSYLQKQMNEATGISLDIEQLTSMAEIFAEIVDAKSPYTAEHSLGVARLSDHLARHCQLDDTTIAEIRVAGLLHDLGKMQVPDKILEYRGYLEGENLSIMRHPSYVTLMILGRIKGFEEISLWAANHHEKLDGSGYPFKKTASELSIESRIIMVADIFQALAQNRPYRKALATDTIVAMLKKQTAQHKLDRHIVDIVAAVPDQCRSVATTC
jgi:putative nucleotidyltransferase with HDIG domain